MTEGMRYTAANSVVVGIVHQAQIKCTINLPGSEQVCSRDSIHNHKRFQETGATFREPPGLAVLQCSGRVKIRSQSRGTSGERTGKEGRCCNAAKRIVWEAVWMEELESAPCPPPTQPENLSPNVKRLGNGLK